jgi:hypothetical protein
MIDLYEKGKAKLDWWKDWRGECVAIVAAGPSAKHVGVEKLKGRINVIAINESFQLCPWADILYSCDKDWWGTRHGEVKKKFSGLRLGFQPCTEGVKAIDIVKTNKKHDDIYSHSLHFDEPGLLGSGGNSGFQMINMSAQFGVTAIALVGFDMQMSQGVHWHGLHNVPMRNPDTIQLSQWARRLDAVAGELYRQGIDVVNCSKLSALNAYPKLTIDEALDRWTL